MKSIILISILLNLPLDHSFSQHIFTNINPPSVEVITHKGTITKEICVISNKSVAETRWATMEKDTQLGLQPEWESGNQAFEIESAGEGFIYIRHLATGRYLEIEDEVPFSGTTLYLSSERKKKTQQFKQIPCGDGYFNLVSRMNLHLAVEIPTGPDKFGRPLFLEIRKTSNTQAFKFTYPNP